MSDEKRYYWEDNEDNFNTNHPELRENEVWLANMAFLDFKKLPYKTKRQGTAYTRSGELIEKPQNWVAVFVSKNERDEYRKGNLNLDLNLEEFDPKVIEVFKEHVEPEILKEIILQYCKNNNKDPEEFKEMLNVLE